MGPETGLMGENTWFQPADSVKNLLVERSRNPVSRSESASRRAIINYQLSMPNSQFPIPNSQLFSSIVQFAVICDRRDNPNETSYTCKLFEGGDNKILKKIGEESAEVVMACKDDDKEGIAGEVADLFYHALVALAHHQVDLRAVYRKLGDRRK